MDENPCVVVYDSSRPDDQCACGRTGMRRDSCVWVRGRGGEGGGGSVVTTCFGTASFDVSCTLVARLVTDNVNSYFI